MGEGRNKEESKQMNKNTQTTCYRRCRRRYRRTGYLPSQETLLGLEPALVEGELDGLA